MSVLAQARDMGDLLPYIGLMAFGFLLGAWGQSARFPVAVALGILLIMAAVVLFILDNDSGRTGIPGLSGD